MISVTIDEKIAEWLLNSGAIFASASGRIKCGEKLCLLHSGTWAIQELGRPYISEVERYVFTAAETDEEFTQFLRQNYPEVFI